MTVAALRRAHKRCYGGRCHYQDEQEPKRIHIGKALNVALAVR
jgi:hypothetical protein